MKLAMIVVVVALTAACAASPTAPSVLRNDGELTATVVQQTSPVPPAPSAPSVSSSCPSDPIPSEANDKFQLLMQDVFARADSATRNGHIYVFEIDDPTSASIVRGELRRSERASIVQTDLYVSLPGALAFGSQDALLASMIASAPNELAVEGKSWTGIRIIGRPVVSTCKPSGPMFGRVEGRVL